MKISGTSIDASTYAMKKAMEMPNILLDLLQQSADLGGQYLGTNAPVSSNPVALPAGAGKLIDIVA
jgi:hypothetical protein